MYSELVCELQISDLRTLLPAFVSSSAPIVVFLDSLY